LFDVWIPSEKKKEGRQADQKKRREKQTFVKMKKRVVGPCPAAGDDCLIFPVGYNSFKRRFLSGLCPVFRVPLFI
jgi:hypothetical protein